MTFAYPMTIIVGVVLIGCFVAGVLIVLRSASNRKSTREKVCDRCRKGNPEHAKFCAHCGQKLES